VLLAFAVIYAVYKLYLWRTQRSSVILAKVSDLKDGQMKEVSVGTTNKVLLIKDKGSFCAVGNKCSHYGAPLVNGAYSNGKLRCPWHGACFNTKTGDIEDFPTCSGIPSYPVRIEGGNVVMKLDALKKPSPALPPFKPGKDDRVFVIIGAGGAGSTAVMQLRKEGFKGRVILIGAEHHLAYDRPKLSKALGIEVEKIVLYKKGDYASQHVELQLGKKVVELDAEARQLRLDDGQTIKYDACLVATGAQPMRLERFITNNDKPRDNVFVLRNVEDAASIGNSYLGQDIVIIGSSFIGMETAAAVVKKAKSVVIIGMEKVPFERVLGLEVGGIMQKLHEREGIQFRMEATCREFTLDETKNIVTSITLADGSVLHCGVVIIGAGAFPTTDFVKESSLVKLERDRSIVVDTYLHTGAPGLFAAGDLARFPLPLLENELVRIEHWGVAMTQGKIAAKNMLGQKKPFTSIPFFWTAQHGKNVRYCGHGIGVDTTLVDTRGDKMYSDDPAFVVFYGRRGKVVAVASLGADPVVAEVAQLMNDGVEITIDELRTAVAESKSAAYISAKLHPNLRRI